MINSLTVHQSSDEIDVHMYLGFYNFYEYPGYIKLSEFAGKAAQLARPASRPWYQSQLALLKVFLNRDLIEAFELKLDTN